ncbi:MAG: DMT family transporter [Bacteroidales bacterium]|nr:DMT family transporter [Bacteroidales bacterium]
MDTPKKGISKSALVGYPAGIIAGIAYGLNPLFAMPLMRKGASVEAILLFRYAISVMLLGLFLLFKRENFRVSLKQAALLAVLGISFSSSSLLLFESYKFISSGLATTLVFLCPVLVALIMVFLRVVPSWPVWIAIAASFLGVVIMTKGDGDQTLNPTGIILAVGSALAYAIFMVILNKSKTVAPISSTLLTFYALCVGTCVFVAKIFLSGTDITIGLDGSSAWLNLTGLAIFPTVIAMAALAVATRNIGATKASVLGVFEPVTAILVGTLVFGEVLTVSSAVGISISIVAVVFMIALTKR